MITNELPSDVLESQQESIVLNQVDAALRRRPLVVIFSALALGFALGVFAQRARDMGYLNGASVGTLFKPLRLRARKAYRTSAGAVQGVVEKLKDIEEPQPRWWQWRPAWRTSRR